ncbi:MAG: ATP-binding protein [Gammaproteobacteria bacterium]|nr:ATP-binding protein [Gammaproteobacteria bacterium]
MSNENRKLKLPVTQANSAIKSIDELVFSLDTGLENLTFEEIRDNDISEILEVLDLEGINPVRVKSVLGNKADIGRVSPVLRRESLARRVCDTLIAEDGVLLSGVVGSGKTTLLKRLVAPRLIESRDVPSIVTIDCSPLRTESKALFQREAVWSMCFPDDELFYSYLRKLQTNDFLLRAIEAKYDKGCIVYFDHVEHVIEGKGILKWLGLSLIPELIKLGYRVVVAHRGFINLHKKKVFSRLADVRVPRLSRTDIANWYSLPNTREKLGSKVSIEDILNETGGVPRLIHDLHEFINSEHCNRNINRSPFEQFCYHRLHNGFMKELQRFIRVAREYPLLWNSISDNQGGLSGLPGNKGVELLIESGVIEKGGNGNYRYTSKIYADRMRKVTCKNSLSLLAVRANFEELHKSGVISKMKHWPEFSAEPIFQMLCSERNPTNVLIGIKNVLSSWKIKLTFYIRDMDNKHLWYSTEKPEELIPLRPADLPNFTRAVQTGSSNVDFHHNIYVPITGNSGLVECVVKCQSSMKGDSNYRVRIQVEFLECVLRGIKPILSNTFERISLARSKKYRDRMLWEFEDNEVHSNRALESSGCLSIVVLEYRNSEWCVSKSRYINKVKSIRSLCLESPNQFRLDRIASYPTGAGLVLIGNDLKNIFPGLDSEAFAAYIRPVGHGESLVVFIFDSEHSNQIDGITQKHLRRVAAEVIGS